tara:strand:+ start:176 stop:652 length:477 start_codon:yes stop_codon:yes gene_type:complete
MPTNIPPLPPLPEQAQPEISVDQLQNSIGFQESSGDYRAYNDYSYGKSNPALGKYQMLWTTLNEAAQRNNISVPASHQEFLNNPQKQEEIADALFNEYIQQAATKTDNLDIAIRMAAAAWYGGPGNMDNYDDNTPQGDYPSLRHYTNSVLQRYKRGGM